jgi:lysophospholipase L1-like esterase
MIGTNNIYRSAEDITKGVKTIVTQIHTKLPESKLLLLGIFPRGPGLNVKDGKPDAIRTKLQAVNAELAKLDDGKQTRYLEIWKQFLAEDGSLSKEIMPDYLHPNEKGYTIWADSMQSLLDEMLK